MSEENNRKWAMRWMEYAKNDLHAATIMLNRDDVAPRIICFLAQQSSEKALKSVLILKGLKNVKTHDLDALSENLSKEDFKKFETYDLSWLTEWSVESRYPGDWAEALFSDARKAVEISTGVINECNRFFE